MNVPFRSLLTVLALSTSAYLLTAETKVGAQEEGRVKMGQSSPTPGSPHVIGTPYDDGGSAKIGSSGSAKVGSSGSARIGSPGPAAADEGSAMIGGYSGRATVGGPAPYSSANVGGGNGSASASVNVPQSWYAPPTSVNQDTFHGIGYQTIDDPFDYKLRLDKRVGGLQGYENGYTNLGAFLPFGNGENSLWFADIRAMITDNGKAGANLGFGHRYYMDELDAVQGFSFWYDYDDGHRGDAASQVGLSYSLYTRYWRINANGYIVTSDDNQIVSSGIFGSPYYVNNNIGINRLNTQETAYSGGEVEIGGPMPVLGRYGVDAYLGVYGLTANGGQDAIGVKGRFEAQINEDLTITGTATQDRVFENNYQLGIMYTFPKNFTPSRWFRQRKVYEAMALADRRDYRVKVDTTQFTTTELLINPADNLPFEVAHIIPPEGVAQGVLPGGTGRIEDPYLSLASYNQEDLLQRQNYDIILISQPNAGDPGVNLTSGITIFQNQRLLSNNGLTNLIESTVGTFALPDTGYGFGITPILTNAFEDTNNNSSLDVTEDQDRDGLLARGEDRNGDGVLDVGEDVNGNGILDMSRAVVVIDPSFKVLQNSLTEVAGFVIDGSNAGTAFPGGELNDGIVSHRDPDGSGTTEDDERITGFWIHNNTIQNVNYGISLATRGTRHEDVDFDGKLDLAEDLDGDGRLDAINEDTNNNGFLDVGEDLDGDGHLDLGTEDKDLDGHLDIAEDLNGDGILDMGTEGIIENNIIIGSNFNSNRGIYIDHSIESLLLKIANNQIGGFRGEDADGDGTLDSNEDANNNGVLDFGEDLDGDGNLDINEDNNGDGLLDRGIGIEIVNTANGTNSFIYANNINNTSSAYNQYGIFNNTLWRSEDVDGDGRLDIDEDVNNNGILDGAEDVDGDGRLDVAEDRDGNGLIDIISNGSGMRLVTTNLTPNDANFYVDFVGNDVSNSRDATGYGLNVFSSGDQANFNFEIFANNQFNNNLGDGALIVADNPGTVRFNTIISGNEFIGNGYFVDDRDGDGSTTGANDVNLTNNLDADGDGADGGDGLRIVSTGANSHVYIAGIGDTTSANSNTFSGNKDDGLQLDATDSAILSEFGVNNMIFIFNNTFNNNGDDGMFVNLDNAQANLSIGLSSDTTLGNSFSNNGSETDLGNGLTMYGQNGSIINGGIYNNTFTANAANGLFIGLESTSALAADYQIVGNTMTFNGLDGAQINMDNASSTGLLLARNNASNNGRNGISFLMEDSTLTNYTILQNTMNNNGDATVPGPGGFTIDLTFTGTFTPAQRAAFENAAARWAEIIIGDIPDVDIGGGVIIDDVLISAEVVDIDGPGGILGQAGPTALRADGTFLPYQGMMQFDSADLADLEASGQLVDVILHEMGHVLGLGTIWDAKGLLQNPSNGDGVTNTTFAGPNATAAYNAIFGVTATATPVENSGGPGTADSHWRESILQNELMTGFLNAGVNPISRITVGQWEDLGYVVDYTAADPYAAPITGGAGARTINMNHFEDYSGPVATRATLNNFFVSPALVPDPGSVGNGLHFQQVNGTATGQVLQNTIDGNNEYGISVNLEGTAAFTFNQTRQNVISNNSLGGVNVVATGDSVFLENSFTGNNVLDNGGIGYHVDSSGNSDISLNFAGPNINTFDGNTDAGIGLEFGGNSTAQVNIANTIVQNTINGTDPDFAGDGIGIRTSGTAVVSAIQIGNPTVLNTRITGNAGNGIFVRTDGSSQILDLDIENVIIEDNGLDGINISRNGTSNLADVLIDGNLIDGNTGDGIDLSVFSSSPPPANFTVTENIVTNNGQNGLNFLASGSTLSNLLIDTNRFEDNGADGINIVGDALGRVNVDILNNDILDNGIHGIDLLAQRPLANFTLANIDALISGNIVDGSGSNGLNILAATGDENNNDDIIASVINNEFTNSGGDGVAIGTTARGEVTIASFNQNLVDGNGRHGVSLITAGLLNASYNNNNDQRITFTSNNGANSLNNIITNNADDGYFISNYNPLTFLGNEIGDVDGDGVANETGVLYSRGTIDATIINDNVSNNGRNGITVYNTSEGQMDITIGNTGQDFTTVNNNGGNGIIIENNVADNNTQLNGGRTATTVFGYTPTLNIAVNNVDLIGNGRDTSLTDDQRIGLFVRVGTTSQFFTGGVVTEGLVNASLTNNTIRGSGTLDVSFESFNSMTAPGASTASNFQNDPLAVLNLILEGNDGGTIDATRFGAFYDNADTIKSAAWILDNTNPNFTADAERRRNAQRFSGDLIDLQFGNVNGTPAPANPAGPPATSTFNSFAGQFGAGGVDMTGYIGGFHRIEIEMQAASNNPGVIRDLRSYNGGAFVTNQFPAIPAPGSLFSISYFAVEGVGDSTFSVTANSQATLGLQFDTILSSFLDEVDLGPAAGDGSLDPEVTSNPLGIDPTFTWNIIP